jgi:TolB-like protein
MASSSISGHGVSRPSKFSNQEIFEEMERIAQSVSFRRCKRLWNILQYAVSARSAGSVTEKMAGTYLQRDQGGEFDPTVDPTVRVLFGRLRNRLETYYCSEGKSNPLRILIPKRCYTPVIEEGSAPAVLAKTITLLRDGNATGDAVATHQSGKPSLAVLPFLNLTNDADKEVYCEGLTDELISALATIPTVDVVARSSAFQFRNEPVDIRAVGNELGVELILEGSVKVEGERQRITAQLATVKDGFALWADTYTENGVLGSGELSPAKIAERIVRALPMVAA